MKWCTYIKPPVFPQVNWRPVIWGLGLQFLLGVTILRWTAGYTFFNFLGMQVKVFLDYADEGSKFVFGEDTYMKHPMAFKVGVDRRFAFCPTDVSPCDCCGVVVALTD